VVPLAVEIAKGFGCDVRILNVVNARTFDAGAIMPEGADVRLAVVKMQEADEYLRTIAPRFEAHEIPTSRDVRLGDPAKEILTAADEFGCDVITMATRARRNMGRLAFGSVADVVVRESRLPVLLYRVAA
jgi:nucleotide-binding universal stress UspA family protein